LPHKRTARDDFDSPDSADHTLPRTRELNESCDDLGIGVRFATGMVSLALACRTAVLLASILAPCACGNASPGGAASSDADAAATGDAPPVPADARSTEGGGADAPVDSPASQTDAGSGGTGLAAQYPCDQGMASDPAIVWMENFEEGSVAAVTSRYDAANDPDGMQLVGDVPAKSCGKASMKLTSGGSVNATDLYKELPGADEWFVRWYAKYQAGVPWHHTGVWFGGYDPPTPYASPHAGFKPNGDDRFSMAIEPVYGVGAPNPRFDTYAYWMQMHSWMDVPSGNTAYYGNAVVNEKGFTADDATWLCVEVHMKLNTDLASGAGAILQIWRNDVLVQSYDDTSPVGCWIKDKYCPTSADGPECTDYPNLCLQPYVPLDQQWRSTSALPLNYFWPQNYITDTGTGSVQFDDMVIAKTRVGCLTSAH
jgi:hypothetical protein